MVTSEVVWGRGDSEGSGNLFWLEKVILQSKLYYRSADLLGSYIVPVLTHTKRLLLFGCSQTVLHSAIRDPIYVGTPYINP